MAYNRENYLKRVLDIQELVKKHQKTDTTLLWIYNNIIEPRYKISYSTYNNYLSIPAARELKKITKDIDMEKIKLTEKQKQDINDLTYEEMCIAWRFGNKKHTEWFDKKYEACDYFYNRLFVELGGLTAEVSKEIGWN